MDIDDILNVLNTATSVVDVIEKLVNNNQADTPTDNPTPPAPPDPTVPPPTGLPAFPTGNILIKDLEYLHPTVQSAANKAIAECANLGYNLTVVETYRTFERQAALYQQGRTTPGNIVTDAEEGQSYHNYGVALDLSPTDATMAAVFQKYGFEWGATWKTFKDPPHFQMTFGLSIAQLQMLYDQGGMDKVWSYFPVS